MLLLLFNDSIPGIGKNFSVKGQIANIFGFEKHTWLCCCSVKAAIHHMYMNGWAYVPIKLYIQKQMAGQIWPTGSSLQKYSLLEFTWTPLPEHSWHTLCYQSVSAASILLLSLFLQNYYRIKFLSGVSKSPISNGWISVLRSVELGLDLGAWF